MRRLIVVVGWLAVCAARAQAQPMMCSTGIIDPGDSEARVLALCGQPDAASQWVETIPAGDDYEGYVTADQIPMAEWDYQNGPDQFVYRIIFQNGIVQEIRN